MLDLDPNRPALPTKDAATLVVAREAHSGIEVFCVQRRKGGFLGGAVVFPGGKLEPSDLDPSWLARSTAPRPADPSFAASTDLLRGLAVAACRESLEEAALLPVELVERPPPAHADLVAWRTRLAASETTLQALLAERGLRLDLGALHPLAHWITPVSESKRFDTRFFLWVCGDEAAGAHDGREVTDSFWASPSDLLRRYEAGSVQLAPPTHRTLAVLTAARTAADAVDVAARSCLAPICPKLVPHRDARGETFALVLPGDPEHDVRDARCPGPSRFVLRDGRFFPEDPPA
jgi:8-oxo-dGTP pyrophosphatase MutT (NUDIX family)